MVRFTTPHHKEGFELFLDTISEMEDTWVVTAWQTIQWMRQPTGLDTIRDFKPFQCDYKVTFFSRRSWPLSDICSYLPILAL